MMAASNNQPDFMACFRFVNRGDERVFSTLVPVLPVRRRTP
jgi:hypothetical protein